MTIDTTTYFPLARRIAFGWAKTVPHLVKEVYQAAYLGLCKAAKRFDPNKNCSFTTYACRKISGEILNLLRSEDFLSRTARRDLRKLLAAREAIGHDQDKLIEYLAIDYDELCRLYLIEQASISQQDYNLSAECTLEDDVCTKDQQAKIRECLKALPISQRDRDIAWLSFVDWIKMSEIATRHNITESRVSQITSRAPGM